MVIVDGSNMPVTDSICYFRERIWTVRVALIWLLVLASVLVTASNSLARLPWLFLSSALFIVGFRLWDDLADLEYDRQHHSARCLTRMVSPRPFQFTVWFLLSGLAGLLFMFEGSGSALLFFGVVLVFFLLYRVTANRPKLRALRVTLILAKYPAFVLLLSQDPNDKTTLLIALAIYLVPLLDEVRSTGPGVLLPAMAFLGLVALPWLLLAN